VPLLVTWHEVWGEHWRRFTPSRLKSLILRVAEWLGAQVGDTVHAVSRLTARRLESYRRSGPVQVIPNGIDGARVRAAADPAPACGPPMVCAGRLFTDKRVELAIAAAAILAPQRSGPLLTVIGEGPEEGALRALAARLGIADRVIFTGKLPDADAVWRVAAGARIALHPSAREGFGIFPLEAMALGLPVVFCPEPGNAVAELVRDGQEGLAVAADAASIAAAAARLLDDQDLWRRCSAAARHRAAEFDWTTVAARFADACRVLMHP
jgi:glycosyltransferase involved in cell wall biosynthesis